MLLFSLSLTAQEIKSIESINKEKLLKLISERNGNYLFINIWATWCVPCREEFPDIVKLHKKYGKSNIDFVSISVDFNEEITSKVIPFLNENNVDFKSYIQAFKNDEELINLINKDWQGAIPVTVIYNPMGQIVEFINGAKSYSVFETIISKYIKKGS